MDAIRGGAALLVLALLAGCGAERPPAEQPDPPAGQIYLYGESHAVEPIMERELELWKEHYDQGVRHLFLELPCYTTEYLNLWMGEEDDAILEQLHEDWSGTFMGEPEVLEFYRAIKEDCPETIFHGTDVGHQYDTTGQRYLNDLRAQGREESEEFQLALEVREQGKEYYRTQDDIYREDAMAENFIRAFDALEGESVMGIYGAAHTGLEGVVEPGSAHPCMAAQLADRYGDALHTEDLSWMADLPQRVDTITVAGKAYEASYFGQEDISGWSDTVISRACWRLEGAYEDFKDCPEAGDVLPYDNYPMQIQAGEVFVIDYTRKDGTVERVYYRSDPGIQWQGKPATEAFTVG